MLAARTQFAVDIVDLAPEPVLIVRMRLMLVARMRRPTSCAISPRPGRQRFRRRGASIAGGGRRPTLPRLSSPRVARILPAMRWDAVGSPENGRPLESDRAVALRSDEAWLIDPDVPLEELRLSLRREASAL